MILQTLMKSLCRFCAVIAFAFPLLTATSSLHAQPATNSEAALQVVSPEIGADRSITFRLYAPNVRAVTLNGDFFHEAASGPAMTMNTAGIWSYVLPPQEPGIYGYYFRTDGVRVPDPSNLLISSSTQYLKSYVEVPGEQPQFWSVRDVPHGQLHELWYRNPTLGQRHVIIYTPPGYDPAAMRTYPVIYLMHSTSDNETFWPRVGRANFILDNLIAEGKTRPAILVMPFGHTSVPRGSEEGAGGKDLYDVAVIGRDLVEQVMPLVETKFHASHEAADRAIFGFAMGGYHAVTIGLNHPGLFGYVVGSSANFRPAMDLATNFAPLNADLSSAKKNLHYLAMMTGTGEAGGIPQSKRVADYLSGLGLHVEWSTPYGTHTWNSWRGYFRDLLERKFFVNAPYSTALVGPPIQ
jgi:enterochelin esterase-like enzyme